jgi:hypothetical protein
MTFQGFQFPGGAFNGAESATARLPKPPLSPTPSIKSRSRDSPGSQFDIRLKDTAGIVAIGIAAGARAFFDNQRLW